MEKLLKDMLFETVENSWTFKTDIEDLLGDPEISTQKVIDTIADFVNQNYTPKK